MKQQKLTKNGAPTQSPNNVRIFNVEPESNGSYEVQVKKPGRRTTNCVIVTRIY